MNTKTDKDYMRLDEAIATLEDWLQEIRGQLTTDGQHPVYLTRVLDAMRHVHSPDDDDIVDGLIVDDPTE